MAFLDASGVKLIDQLRQPIQKANRQAQDPLQAALGRLSSRQTASNKASGRVLGEYAPAELSRAGSRASTGIEDVLSGALAGGSYDEVLKQQEHERSLALAQEIGDLSAPSVLEQVLAGLGGGGRAGAQFYQLYNQFPRKKSDTNYANYLGSRSSASSYEPV